MNKNIKDTQKEDQVVGKNNQQQDQIEAEVLETADSEGVSRTPRQARDDNQRADTQRTQAWQPPSVRRVGWHSRRPIRCGWRSRFLVRVSAAEQDAHQNE